MSQQWYLHLLWILVAGGVGFAVTAIGSTWLRLPRPTLLVPYTVAVGALFGGYLSWSGLDLTALLAQNLVWGLVGAAVLGFILVRNVLSQPGSVRAGGLALAFEIIWLGVVYGAADGLLLSALPLLATWQACAALGLTGTLIGDVLVGVLAIVASMYMTAAYHAGYAEFRGPRMTTALFGNSVISLGYLLTANPLASVLSHAVMHVAAVLRGPSSVVQLPPHYELERADSLGRASAH
jgi:hypothetical protein